MDALISHENARLRDELAELGRRKLQTPPDPDPLTRHAALWERGVELGLPGLALPPEWGGRGLDGVAVALALEGLGHGCDDAGFVFSLNAHMWACAWPVFRFGSDEAKRRHLRDLATGAAVGAHAMTEPDSGSDVSGLRTTLTAEASGDGYRLTGAKSFITNAPIADVAVVFARHRAGQRDVTAAVLVDLHAPRVTRMPATPTIGLETAPLGELVFDDVEVAQWQLLGKPSAGWAVFNATMRVERTFILAAEVGRMTRQLDDWADAAARGGAVSRAEAAALRIRAETTRGLVARAAAAASGGGRTFADASMAKLAASEAGVMRSLAETRRAGMDSTLADASARGLADALAGRLYSGTSEMQRDLLAASLGLPG